MTSFGLLGDASTTTALALATSWPSESDAVLFEADPSGGSLAAWLDVPVTPSLSSVVAAVPRDGGSGVGAVVDSLVRRAAGGLPFVPCPYTVREAARTVAEASQSIFPAVIESRSITSIFDHGRVLPTALPPTISMHDLAIVVHRQERASAPAEAVRLERCAELVEAAGRARAGRADHEVTLLVIGDGPFDPDEIAAHCSVAQRSVLRLADDPLTASVLAGGGALSARRLRRQPLMSDARRVAAQLAAFAARPRELPAPDPRAGVDGPGTRRADHERSGVRS